MHEWKNECLSELSKSETDHDFYRIIAIIAKEIGFDYCGYEFQLPLPISCPLVVVHHNYPEEWHERYQEKNYREIDQRVKHSQVSNSPFIWTAQCISTSPQMCDDSRSHGLCFGWTKSLRHTNGAHGTLTLARPAGKLDNNDILTLAKADWIAEISLFGMAEFLFWKHIPEIKSKITHREKEVLRWTADGKTAYEIGKILLISENTVIFHLKNVMTKLNTSNKIQTAIKAIALRLI